MSARSARQRLEPDHLAEAGGRGRCQSGHVPLLAPSSLLAPPQVEAAVGRHWRRATSAATSGPRTRPVPASAATQRLLQRVLGVLQRPEHPVAVRQQLGAVRLHQPSEVVTLQRAHGHLDVVHHQSRHRRDAEVGGRARPVRGSRRCLPPRQHDHRPQESDMGRIVISTNLTLDGTSDDPTGEEGTTRGGWFGAISGEDREAWEAVLLAEARNLSAYLIGCAQLRVRSPSAGCRGAASSPTCSTPCPSTSSAPARAAPTGVPPPTSPETWPSPWPSSSGRSTGRSRSTAARSWCRRSWSWGWSTTVRLVVFPRWPGAEAGCSAGRAPRSGSTSPGSSRSAPTSSSSATTSGRSAS